MPINKKSGESKSEFISRCISEEIKNGYDKDQAAAICYNYVEENFESYDDYPKGVREVAQRVLNYVEKNGWGGCGTNVGKQRAHQLANGEPISLSTIKRMKSFLSRHKGQGADKGKYGEGCGRLMYDAWGGTPALTWATRKINQIENLNKFNSIRKFEKKRLFVDSSNVDRVMYNTDTSELTIRFTNDEIYTYPNIDEELFNQIIDGVDAPKTSGENDYGEWKKGVGPSVGATVYKRLVKRNAPFKIGGSFR